MSQTFTKVKLFLNPATHKESFRILKQQKTVTTK